MNAKLPFIVKSIVPCVALLLVLTANSLANPSYLNSENPLTGFTGSSLKNFSGSYTKKKISLKWSLSNTTKAISFEIERSVSGLTFVKIGTINRNKNNSYLYTDKCVFQPAYFYRIKIIQEGLEPLYSDAINISQEETKTKSIPIKKAAPIEPVAEATIPTTSIPVKTVTTLKYNKINSKGSPIFFKDNLLLEMQADKAGEIVITLVSTDIRVQLTRSLHATAGLNQLAISDLDYLPEGNYQVEVKTGKQVMRCRASK